MKLEKSMALGWTIAFFSFLGIIYVGFNSPYSFPIILGCGISLGVSGIIAVVSTIKYVTVHLRL